MRRLIVLVGLVCSLSGCSFGLRATGCDVVEFDVVGARKRSSSTEYTITDGDIQVTAETGKAALDPPEQPGD